ncbi:MAG TPA: hypothetical protein VGC79_19330 [Polyangiaceae bacterium]
MSTDRDDPREPDKVAQPSRISDARWFVVVPAFAVFTVLLCTSKVDDKAYLGLIGLCVIGANLHHIESFSVAGFSAKMFKREFARVDSRLSRTEEAIRQIVAFQPGHFAHMLLEQIRNRQHERYEDSNAHRKRLLELLLDNGYLQPPEGSGEVIFSPYVNGRWLYELAALTPVAELVVQLRADEGQRVGKNLSALQSLAATSTRDRSANASEPRS